MHHLRDLASPDPKTAAKRLRTALKERNIDLGHGECLDLVARLLGLKDWNVLAARSGTTAPPAGRIEAPRDWVLCGANLAAYVGGLDATEKHLGKPVFWLRNAIGENGFATLMQSVSAETYKNRRLRFSGWLRAENVDGVAGMFMRADDDKGRFVALRTLEHLTTDGALRGTVGWSHRAIVVDIPAESQSVSYGFTLARGGTAWFAGFDLQTVGLDVPVTKPGELAAP